MEVLTNMAFYSTLRTLDQLFQQTELKMFNLLHCILFTDLGNRLSSGDLHVNIKSIESHGLCAPHSHEGRDFYSFFHPASRAALGTE